MRKAARTDANHTEIVQSLLDIGCSVQSLAAVGVGCPDLLWGLAGVNGLIEVKNPEVRPSDRVLTEDQKRFHSSWKGHIDVVETTEQAVTAVRRTLAKESAA
jgi:hypothetical protein